MKQFANILVFAVILNFSLFRLPVLGVGIFPYRIAFLFLLLFLAYAFVIKDQRLRLGFGRQSKVNFYQVFYCLWIFWSFLSFLWAEDKGRWMRATFFVLTGCLSAIYLLFALEKKIDFQKVFRVFLYTSFIHHAFAWYEVITHHYYFENIGTKPRIPGIPMSSLANQNNLANFFLAAFAIAIIVFLDTKKLGEKLFCLAFSLSSLYLIYKSSSKAILLSVLLFVFFLIILRYWDRKSLAKWMLGIICITAIAVLVLLIVPSLRMKALATLSRVFVPNRSTSNRLNMLMNGLHYLINSFGLGVGAGNIEYHMLNDQVFKVDAPNIHNWFMEILVAYGLLVFVFYCIMLLLSVSRFLFMAKNAKDIFIRNTSIVFAAYLLVFPISSTASSSNIVLEWHWVYQGLIMAFAHFVMNANTKRIKSDRHGDKSHKSHKKEASKSREQHKSNKQEQFLSRKSVVDA